MKNLFSIVLAHALLLTGHSAFAQLQKEWDSPNAIPVVGARVEVKKQIEISVDVPGTLITLTPNERGEIVKKGQVIVEIDKERVVAELAELDHAVTSSDILIDFAKITVDQEGIRLKDMKDRNKEAGSMVFTENEIREQDLALIKANAEVRKSQADKRGAELKADTKRVELKQYTRHAEFDGIVVDLHKKAIGASVRQGDPIMTIVNFEEMLVELKVNPNFKRRINIGDKVLVRPTSSSPDEAPKNGGVNGSPFRSTKTDTANEAITTSLPQASPEEEICVGRVTFVGARRESDKENTLVVECVVQNKIEGIAKYLLNEGSTVDAVILSP
ncbi:MAG: HlyD family efflux transporter periplasmic adaptor subunit [Fuerstiella sp.]